MSATPDYKSVFDAQRKMLPALRASTAEERIAKLERLQGVIHAHFDEAVAALNKDLGRPPFEAVFDIGSTFAEIAHVSAGLADWMKPTEVTPGGHAAPGASARLVYEPRGRVLVFGPWNFAFSLLFQPLVGAIAAGNAVVLKPSELSPATAEVAAKIVAEVFDEAEVALFQGGPEVAEALLELPFEHIFFTGSTPVGRRVMSAAGKHLSSVTLELGGKCPAVVGPTADIEKAADRIVWGKYLNAGQICLSPNHVWVHADQAEAFTQAVLKRVRECYYPTGTYNRQDSARILSERHLARLEALLDKSVSAGASMLTGGQSDGLHLEPVVLADVAPDNPIVQEEIFGPILPILTYEKTDELIEALDDREKPLALYVFSEDRAFAEDVISQTSSGGVTVNDVLQHAADPALPFGGVGCSGVGAYHGFYSFRELSHAKSVYYQAADNPAEKMFRPPYGNRLPM